jgi:ATP-dependent Clp protease adaptor protein ClpS
LEQTGMTSFPGGRTAQPLNWQIGGIKIFCGAMTDAAGTGQPGVIEIEKTSTKEERALPWNVVVHNDPINLMSYVTMVLQRVFGYPRTRAETLMLEVHTRGRSLVWSGEREQGELYVHQLHGYQLLATLEKSET